MFAFKKLKFFLEEIGKNKIFFCILYTKKVKREGREKKDQMGKIFIRQQEAKFYLGTSLCARNRKQRFDIILSIWYNILYRKGVYFLC